MHKHRFLIFCCLMVMMVSCSKDPAPGRPYYFMDNDFKDYSYFKPGTYWIYRKDTVTTDSIAVISSGFNLKEPDTASYSWQQSHMEYSSSWRNDTTTLLGDFLAGSSVFYLKEVRDNQEHLVFFSLKPPGYVLQLSPSMQLRYRELKDTTLNGQPFGAVMIFENLAAPSDSTQPKELWYAKNLGIIRKELYNGEVWFLERSQIVQ